jgi:hypothetical protein
VSVNSTIKGRVSGLIPDDWFDGPADVTIDRDEILIIGRIPAPATEGLDEAAVEEAITTRIGVWRGETRDARIRVARGLEREFERKVSWGVRCGEHEELFTILAAPAMTRLRMDERRVLDTLIAGGVARSRSEALAWCVRLVGKHEGDWLRELREALGRVGEVRAQGPQA